MAQAIARPTRQTFVPLVQFCHEQKLDYNQTWRACVTGKIPARREGRVWLVRSIASPPRPQAQPETPPPSLDSSPPVDPPLADSNPVASEILEEANPEVVRPEVHTLLPQLHGGSLRQGNPGNAGGGGRHLQGIRQQLRELLTGGGLELLKRTIAREEVDYRAVVVSQGKGMPSQVKVVALPVDTRVAVAAVKTALEASEGMVSPEKPGIQRRRVLEIVMRHE